MYHLRILSMILIHTSSLAKHRTLGPTYKLLSVTTLKLRRKNFTVNQALLQRQWDTLFCSPRKVAIKSMIFLQKTSLLSQVFSVVMLAMIVYFIISIIHSMAQNYAKRMDEDEIHKHFLHRSKKTS